MIALSELKLEESALFQQDNPDAQDANRLLEWLHAGGINFPKLYMQWYSHDFRGVHALGAISSGDVLLRVPISHIMTGEDAKKCEMGAKILKCGYECNSDDSFLAAMLLQEKHKQNSFWKPYLDTLPKHYANMPIYFGDELLSELKGSFSLDMRQARIDSLKSEYEGICKGVPEFAQFTYDEFVWARLVVITRQFGIKVDGVETDGLVPYADMLNHKLPRETEWTYEEKDRAFTITALQPMARGSQVYDSYGRKCNSRFFVNYGFSLDENPDNEAVINLALSPTDPMFKTKIGVIGGRYNHRRRCQIPSRYDDKKTLSMFTFLRFISANADASEMPVIVALSPEAGSEIKIDPLSIRNEVFFSDGCFFY